MRGLTGEPEPTATKVDWYAEFERKRGGLLYVLQAGVGVFMFAAASAAGRNVALALGLMAPAYFLYFVFRGSVWRRLYRPWGHVEDRAALREARHSVWLTMALVVALPLLLSLNPHRPPLGLAVVLLLAEGLAVVLLGRVPVDGCALSLGIVATYNTLQVLGGGPAPFARGVYWLPGMAALAGFGLWEHARFVRATRGGPRG